MASTESFNPVSSIQRSKPMSCDSIAEDEALAARAQEGDRLAFEMLIARHEHNIFKTILRITRHYEDAEDAVQEATLKAYRYMKQFRGQSKFSTWFSSIAINQALMCLRKRRRNADTGNRALDPPEEEYVYQISDCRPSPEQLYGSLEAMTMLHGTIYRMPRRLRVAFVLRYIEEFSTEEIADKLGISDAALKSRLMRARTHLRKRLRHPTLKS